MRERRLDADCLIPSADGRLVACFKHAGVVVRDLVSGQERRLVEKPSGKRQSVKQPYLSPNGKLLAYVLDDFRSSPQIRIVVGDGSADRALLDQPEIERARIDLVTR